MGQTTGRVYRRGGFAAVAALSMLLAACGAANGSSASASAASPTPTCPPAVAFKSVTGTISATGTGSITITASNSTATLVQLTANTRITRMVPATVSDLKAGTSVQVTTDTSVTTAQRILVLSSSAGGTGGFGGFGGGRGFARGTPPAGANPACFQRQRQGSQAGFQGLRGTVDSASATQLVLDDPQGQTFSVAITTSTVIETSAAGAQSDLHVGATVTATGTATSNGISARAITVLGATTK